jgi:hypothetical protein
MKKYHNEIETKKETLRAFASRIEESIFKGVEVAAKEDTRSLNGQINVLLKEALEARKNKN